MPKLFIENIPVHGKRVIVRVDFNVPLQGGEVENDKRLRESLPTVQYLCEQGARVILMSHLGRPKGVTESLRMAPVAKAFSALLGKPVLSVPDCVGLEVEAAVASLKEGEVLLLENLRFHAEEEKNDPEFSRKLASLADIYVNDAFGTAHRAHASTEGITKYIAYSLAGYLMKKELNFLGQSLEDPKRPFTAIIGGAKISGKIDVIESLLPKVDKLLIGGGMAFTFLKAMGIEIGKSLVEVDKIDVARSLLERAGGKLQLPIDFQITDTLDFPGRKIGAPLRIVPRESIPQNRMAVDIGPETIQLFSSLIRESKTVIWNGPMGVFEIESCAQGTFGVAKALVESTAWGAVTIVGGGDSAAAIEQMGLENKVSHVSTGGGACLEFLEGKDLPGVAALTNRK